MAVGSRRNRGSSGQETSAHPRTPMHAGTHTHAAHHRRGTQAAGPVPAHEVTGANDVPLAVSSSTTPAQATAHPAPAVASSSRAACQWRHSQGRWVCRAQPVTPDLPGRQNPGQGAGGQSARPARGRMIMLNRPCHVGQGRRGEEESARRLRNNDRLAFRTDRVGEDRALR